MNTSDIINTWGQLVAAGGGVGIFSTPTSSGRVSTSPKFQVIRITAQGREIPTDPRPPDQRPWYDHGRKTFLPFAYNDKAKALAAAQAWVAEQGWYDGPWARNRMGDYLPTNIHKRFPLRPRNAK
jgi:hypothetical protein